MDSKVDFAIYSDTKKTHLDGLPMGTRYGALDPAVVLYLMREKGMDSDAMSVLLNFKSGLLGVSGISGDTRTP